MKGNLDKSVGIGKAVLICLFFYLIFFVVHFLLPQMSEVLGLEFDYPTKFFIQLIISWTMTIWVGFQLTGQTFRSIYPIKTFSPRLLVPLFCLLFGLSVILARIVGWIPMSEEMRNSLVQNFSSNREVMLVNAVILAPIMEEIFFRGIVFKGFLGRYSVQKSILAASILFGVFHLNPWQLAVAISIGFIFSILVIQAGSLLVAIYGHFVVNATPTLILPFVLQNLGHSQEEIESMVQYPAWVLFIAIPLLFIGGYLLKREGVDFRFWKDPQAASTAISER